MPDSSLTGYIVRKKIYVEKIEMDLDRILTYSKLMARLEDDLYFETTPSLLVLRNAP